MGDIIVLKGRNPPRAPTGLIIPVFVSLLVLLIGYVIGPRSFRAGDTSHYIAMIERESVEAPFAYRILVPEIIKLMPLDHETSFFLITYVSSFGTLIILF